MAIVQLEDLFGTVECIVFPKVLEKCLSLVREDEIVVIDGNLDCRMKRYPRYWSMILLPWKKRLNGMKNLPVSNRYMIMEKKITSDGPLLWIKLKDTSQLNLLEQVKPLLREHHGDVPVVVYIESTRKRFRAESALWVKEDAHLIKLLRRVFGEKSVKITGI